MKKNNQAIAHEFFYSSNRDQSGSHFYFRGDEIFSYSTIIGKLATGSDGRPVLLYSRERMSATTGKQLSYLRNACPHDKIAVPLEYGRGSWPDIAAAFISRLETFTPERLKYAAARREFKSLFDAAERYSNLITPIQGLPAYADTYAAISTLAGVKELKAVCAKKEAARKAKAARLIKKYSSAGYMNLISKVFGSHENFPERAELKKALNPNGKLSFTWIEGDNVLTSQGITLAINTVKPILRRWKMKELSAGQHVGPYEIISIQSGHVTIGCHVIPAENIMALYDEVMK